MTDSREIVLSRKQKTITEMIDEEGGAGIYSPDFNVVVWLDSDMFYEHLLREHKGMYLLDGEIAYLPDKYLSREEN